MRDAEREAKNSALRIQGAYKLGGFNPLGGGAAGGEGGLPSSGVLREATVLLREISRGNWSRVPGSLSILIQRLGVLKYLLTPMVGALTGVAVAAGFVAYHFYDLAKRADNTLDGMNRLHISLTNIADSFEKAKDKMAEYAEMFRKLREPEDNEVQAIQDRVKGMREEFEWRQKVAKQNGQTPEEEKRARVREAFDEYNLVAVASQQAKAKLDQAKLKSDSARQKAEFGANDEGKIAGLEKSKELSGKIADAVQTAFNKKNENGLAIGSDEFNVEVGGVKYRTSLDKATAALNQWTRDLTIAKEARKKDEQDVKDAVEEERKAREHASQLSRETAEKEADIHRAENEPLEKDQTVKEQRLLRGSVNSLQSVGAYAMPGQVELIDVNKKMESHLRAIKTIIGGGGRGGQSHANVHFGRQR